MSSLAQEESRSISENTTWGKRKQFAEGKTSVGYSAFLGYDKDFKINEEQAKVVKLIYKLFLGGRSFYAITKELEKRGIKSPSGKDKWYISTVRSILTNEKYRGDALIQKEYTADFLDKTRRKNTGEIPQYYVEEHHEAIIPPDLFDFVQSEIKRREQNGKHSGVSIFANKIKCGCCGGWYGAKVWHSTDKYKRVIWQCNHKFRGTKCSTPHFTEDEIKELFVRAVNLLLAEKEEIISTYEMMRDKLFSTTALVEERRALENELNVTARLVEDCIKENARIAQDQTTYEERYQSLVERYESAKKRYDEIVEQISDRTVRGEQVSIFLGKLREQDLIDTFDDDLWLSMVGFITVHDKSKVTVTFKDGSKIKLDR